MAKPYDTKTQIFLLESARANLTNALDEATRVGDRNVMDRIYVIINEVYSIAGYYRGTE